MTLAFTLSLICVFVVTILVTFIMERRNSQVDYEIMNICEEIRPRFEQEGYVIKYKTRTSVSGILCGHFNPERVICFQEIGEAECEGYTSSDYSSDSMQKKNKNIILQ